jgi:hypothetical protein
VCGARAFQILFTVEFISFLSAFSKQKSFFKFHMRAQWKPQCLQVFCFRYLAPHSFSFLVSLSLSHTHTHIHIRTHTRNKRESVLYFFIYLFLPESIAKKSKFKKNDLPFLPKFLSAYVFCILSFLSIEECGTLTLRCCCC